MLKNPTMWPAKIGGLDKSLKINKWADKNKARVGWQLDQTPINKSSCFLGTLEPVYHHENQI